MLIFDSQLLIIDEITCNISSSFLTLSAIVLIDVITFFSGKSSRLKISEWKISFSLYFSGAMSFFGRAISKNFGIMLRKMYRIQGGNLNINFFILQSIAPYIAFLEDSKSVKTRHEAANGAMISTTQGNPKPST